MFSKDKSWVNKVIFPFPNPPSYDANTFDAFRAHGRLAWIPRHRAAVRREDGAAHDPNSVPVLAVPCQGGSDRIIIFCHGNSEDLGHLPGVLMRLRSTMKAHVIGIEYTGYGVSGGTPSESSLNNDLLVLYSFLRGVMRWDPKSIFLFGFSIGTGPVVQLASRERVGGITLLAPYTSIRAMVQEIMPRAVGKVAQFLIANRFVSSRAIRTVECPTLIVHGKADKLIPYKHGEELHEACGARRKRLYLAETLDHCYSDDELEMFVLFPMLDFHGAARPGGRQLDLPEYIFAKPADPKGDPIPAHEPSASAPAPGVPLAELAAPLPGKAAAKPPDWACPTCTFANDGDYDRCDMCDRPRPEVVEPTETEEDRKEEEAARTEIATHGGEAAYDLDHYWSCARCTFLNPPALVVCATCEADRPPRVASDEAAPPGAGGPGPWPCGRCTYVNDPAARACGVCAELRPAAADDIDLGT